MEVNQTSKMTFRVT